MKLFGIFRHAYATLFWLYEELNLAIDSDEKSPALKDHGYTRNHDLSSGAGPISSGNLISGWSEINVRIVDKHLLHITLSPSSSSAASNRVVNSLNATVRAICLLFFTVVKFS